MATKKGKKTKEPYRHVAKPEDIHGDDKGPVPPPGKYRLITVPEPVPEPAKVPSKYWGGLVAVVGGGFVWALLKRKGRRTP